MSNQNEVTGILYKKSDAKQVSEKLKLIDFIIKTEGTYPQYIALQTKNDKCDLLNGVNENDTVKVSYNLEGRLWTDPKTNIEKAFNQLSAWKVEVTDRVVQPGAAQVTTSHVPDNPASDDLPF